MQPNRSNQQSDSRHNRRLLLSFGLPFLLVVIFAGFQFIDLDSIGWSHGFSHPLSGWDHLVTMLAVGIWAAQLRGQAVWMLPLAFVGVMSLGGLAGAAGLAIPSVEGIILLSCAVFGVLITRKIRFSAKINVMIVAFFAFFHGFAHGQEISTSASLISYTLGFMLATLLLHGAGILVAKLVVFCISCLLTIIFSNAALAKTTESIVGNNVIDTVFAQDAGVTKITPFWIDADQAGYAQYCFVFAEDEQCSEDFSRYGSGVNDPSSSKLVSLGFVDFVRTPVKDDSQSVTLDSNSDGLIFKQPAEQRLDNWLGKWLFNPDYINHSALDFKHYYPDINHTPGKQLLSNGVGLTSPPVALPNVLAHQASSNLRKTPISSVEDTYLQSIFAKSDTGNLTTQTIKHTRHDCAFRNLRETLQRTVRTVRFQNNFFSNLTLIDKSRRSSGAAIGVISRVHLLFASQKSLPLAMRKTWPVKAHPILT
ncbi:urease accessory protein [Methylomonas methanica]|uniref:Urease accessory protein n=1 Tax=Methylomonas methanica TaxID=421 RepID=A0ABY2CV31_METMH|nr:HupE/UreJ family protein [Methylomonas methanica]TCV86187.1 urease accessory protein [Methylomonas methanica]